VQSRLFEEEKRLTSTKASSIEVNKFSLSFTAVYLNYILYFERSQFDYLKIIIFHSFCNIDTKRVKKTKKMFKYSCIEQKTDNILVKEQKKNINSL